MKRILLILLILCVGLSLSAQNSQKLYRVDSEIYTGIRALYSEVGIAPPSSSGPWTAAELEDMLDRVPLNELSRRGKELYKSLLSDIEVRTMQRETAQGSIGFSPAFEMYVHKNDQNYQQDTDWLYNYDLRKPLITIPVELFLTDYVYSQTDFAVMRTRNTENDATGIVDSSEAFEPLLSTNFPFGEELVNHVDLNFPERAVTSLGFGRLNISLGRDDLKWSSGKTGSLTVGDHLDFYDFVRFTSFHKNMKYTYLVAGFDPPGWDDESQDSTVNDEPIKLKMYVAHRFEFRFLQDKLSLALSEAMIYQGATVDFRYLNPSMLYHNLFIRGNANSTLAFELEFTPLTHTTIYANVLADEFPYPGEDQTSDGAHPTGIGQQYGAEGTYTVGPGFLTGWFEYVKTDPMLYLRESVDYIVNRRIFNMESGFSVVKNFMGYQYGNDLILLAGGLDYTWHDFLSSSLKVVHMRHGENSMDTEWGKGPEYVNQQTPYDDPETEEKTVEDSLLVSVNLKVAPFSQSNVASLQTLNVFNQLDFLKHQNKDNERGTHTSDIQWTFGVNWSL